MSQQHEPSVIARVTSDAALAVGADYADAHELNDNEFTLESDEPVDVLTQPIKLPMRRTGAPPPPPRAAGHAGHAGHKSPPALRKSHAPRDQNEPREMLEQREPREPRARVPSTSGVFPAPAANLEEANTQLMAARTEIARLAKQMRARDAYLSELERALDASTRQLEQAGIGTVENAAKLLGRLRGQAFRIAELESDFRQATLELVRLRAAARGGAPDRDDLRRIRGIGPRFAEQLGELGFVSFGLIAGWTEADVSRVSERLRIRPERIERDGWIAQARSLHDAAHQVSALQAI
jgi:predicted flap endonuclease-1-like 5' DNA nuclease